MQQIANSNLLMLVIQGECDCARRFPPITLEPKEVKYILLILGAAPFQEWALSWPKYESTLSYHKCGDITYIRTSRIIWASMFAHTGNLSPVVSGSHVGMHRFHFFCPDTNTRALGIS